MKLGNLLPFALIAVGGYAAYYLLKTSAPAGLTLQQSALLTGLGHPTAPQNTPLGLRLSPSVYNAAAPAAVGKNAFDDLWSIFGGGSTTGLHDSIAQPIDGSWGELVSQMPSFPKLF